MNKVLKRILFSVILITSLSSLAAVPNHNFTQEQWEEIAEHNRANSSQVALSSLFDSFNGIQRSITGSSTLPYAEFSEAGYVIFSEHESYNSRPAKLAMAQHLPQNITLVVYTGNASESYQRELFNRYARFRDPSLLKVIFLPQADRGFWARDGIPVPVWKTNYSGAREFTVVDARYYHEFEPDQEVSDFFSANLLSHTFYYEGGNYAANSRGDCIVVNNNGVKQMTNSVFSEKYGCRTLVRLPHTKGIGHIDESVKFMDDDTVLVDDEGYAGTLENKGFRVVRMIRPLNTYETYINALVVNGTAFVPVFGQEGDSRALNIYQSFGLRTVPVNSTSLSNEGMGSIHCITMSYPPIPFNELLKHMGAKATMN